MRLDKVNSGMTEWFIELVAQIIGLVGVAGVLAAYWLLTSGKFTNHDPRYLWLNIAATLAILFSLFYQWNLPSVVAQILWILVSIAGLIRIKRSAR
jgi:uncharacterized membrane protein YuzA (DUF378 family)